MQQYSQVFSWLLCIKRVSLAMRQLWTDLSCTTASANNSSRRDTAARPSGSSGFADAAAYSMHQGTVAAGSSDRQEGTLSREPGQTSPDSQGRQQEVRQRVKVLQLFRHEAAQFAAALQSYMQAQLFGQCWQQLQNDIQVCRALCRPE